MKKPKSIIDAQIIDVTGKEMTKNSPPKKKVHTKKTSKDKWDEFIKKAVARGVEFTDDPDADLLNYRLKKEAREKNNQINKKLAEDPEIYFDEESIKMMIEVSKEITK